MKKLAALGLLLSAPVSLAAQTSLTIYNDGRVLVRREVEAAVPKGASNQTLTLGALEPASLFSLDSSVVITRIAYDGAVDEGSALRRSVGKRLLFRIQTEQKTDTVSALVLGVDPLRLQLPDGRVMFTPPGTALYPADVVVAEPTVRLGFESARAQKSLRLGYFTSGASWQASYQIVLGGKQAKVTGMAVIPSQTLRMENAEVQLLAGAVGRADQFSPKRMMAAARNVMAEATLDGVPAEQQVGEFHLYTLPGRTTLLPGLTTSVALFEPAAAPYEKTHTVRGVLPYRGTLPRGGDEEELPVEVTYTLKRPHQSGFGGRPLPGGVARMFEQDSAGRLQLVGEARSDHTPAGEDLRLSAGTAFDLTARRVQTSYVTQRDSTKPSPRTIAVADYRVTVANATDSAETVEVMEVRAGEWSVVSSSVPAEKLSSTRTRFRVKVPARGEAQLTYRLRVVW
jgi:hypothetical protein